MLTLHHRCVATSHLKRYVAKNLAGTALGRIVWLAVMFLITAQAFAADISAPASSAKHRDFLLTYSFSIMDLPADKPARVWIAVPPTTKDQQITLVKSDLPDTATTSTEPKYNNSILSYESPAQSGDRSASITWKIRRFEVHSDKTSAIPDATERQQFLKPDGMVPVGGKTMVLLKGRDLPKDQMQIAGLLYDVVDSHMQYRKDKPGYGRGDAVWACDSGFGNCTDFHSLFISLSRAMNIPAKFEIGLPLPPQRGSGAIPGYHCWAKFAADGRGWIPVDISEANKHPDLKDYYFGNLTEDRVAFSTGRDIDLVPKQHGPPLNYMIYPYVECDNQPWPADKVKCTFSFDDVADNKK